MAIEFHFVLAILLSGSLTGILSYIVTVAGRHPKHCADLPYPFLYFAIQLPRTNMSAISKWSVRTAPTSPSPGTLWMATTPPATSTPSVSITGTDLILRHCTSLTAQQLAMVPPSGTPALWETFVINPTSYGYGCTDPHWIQAILIQAGSMLTSVSIEARNTLA